MRSFLEKLVLSRIILRWRNRRYDAVHARVAADREARERALAAELGALRVISLDRD